MFSYIKVGHAVRWWLSSRHWTLHNLHYLQQNRAKLSVNTAPLQMDANCYQLLLSFGLSSKAKSQHLVLAKVDLAHCCGNIALYVFWSINAIVDRIAANTVSVYYCTRLRSMDLLRQWSRCDQGTNAVLERGFRIIFQFLHGVYENRTIFKLNT